MPFRASDFSGLSPPGPAAEGVSVSCTPLAGPVVVNMSITWGDHAAPRGGQSVYPCLYSKLSNRKARPEKKPRFWVLILSKFCQTAFFVVQIKKAPGPNLLKL